MRRPAGRPKHSGYISVTAETYRKLEELARLKECTVAALVTEMIEVELLRAREANT